MKLLGDGFVGMVQLGGRPGRGETVKLTSAKGMLLELLENNNNMETSC